MTDTAHHRPLVRAGLVLALTLCVTTPARAQLDPLLFLKRLPPNVVLIVDTSAAMLEGDHETTRFDVARSGIARAAADNAGIGERWALVGLRDESSDRSSNGVLLPFGATAAQIVAVARRSPDNPDGFRPSAPGRLLALALEDALSEVETGFSRDHHHGIDCRNTVVVLIAGGPETSRGNPSQVAARFSSVSSPDGPRRVPIYVVGIMLDRSQRELQEVAAESGGQYYDGSTPADVTRAINVAIQSAYARSADYNRGVPSEYQPVGPIVGTVDLTDARSAGGGNLSGTRVVDNAGGRIPQRRNVMVTAGFELNSARPAGMEGVLRAFRAFQPVTDDSRPSGYAFVADGTPLWPDVDGRIETRGRARTPIDPDARNVFTYIPGRGMVPFALSHASSLAPHLGDTDVAKLIPFVRELPLGPIVGSTPALMDPPSQEPPPDGDYGRVGVPDSFADKYRDRRSIIWVGGNNGMLHAIDARTGFEVWAFIPYNLLPKLRTLSDGQSIDQFDYFVDSSPKVAEVKLDGHWRTVLVIGQAYGGTFYQAFDVTDAGMHGPGPSSDDHAAVLTSFSQESRIRFLWSFPRYSVFDPTLSASFHVDRRVYPGGTVRFFGDLKSTATPAEKSVGFTWSAPAISPLTDDHTLTAVSVGSGYFPEVGARMPGRGRDAPPAGRSFYLINMATGALVGGATACGGSGSRGCVDVGDGLDNDRRNALQADPVVTGAREHAQGITTAYLGDLDGKLHRFRFASTGEIRFSALGDTRQPIYSSAALSWAGSSIHVFLSTGSDRLPPALAGTSAFKLYGVKDGVGGTRASVTFSRAMPGGMLERPTASPAVAGGVVFFSTVTESAHDPCADARSSLYGLTYLGGAAYDTDGSGSVSDREHPRIATLRGRATAPFVSDGHVFLGTSGANGSSVEMFGDPETFNTGHSQTGLRILSWRGID